MAIKYAHTNIIAQDWKKLVRFYETVFECKPVPPERNQSGAWLDKATGVNQAHLRGMHSRLPGFGDSGPTLEIYQYTNTIETPKAKPNSRGYGHLAFQVDDVQAIVAKALECGASKLGEVTEHDVEGVGHITLIYIADPEGNIIELQHWR